MTKKFARVIRIYNKNQDVMLETTGGLDNHEKYIRRSVVAV